MRGGAAWRGLRFRVGPAETDESLASDGQLVLVLAASSRAPAPSDLQRRLAALMLARARAALG